MNPEYFLLALAVIIILTVVYISVLILNMANRTVDKSKRVDPLPEGIPPDWLFTEKEVEYLQQLNRAKIDSMMENWIRFNLENNERVDFAQYVIGLKREEERQKLYSEIDKLTSSPTGKEDANG